MYLLYTVSMRKLFLFDIDGTLIDNVHDDNKFTRTIHKVHGIHAATKRDFSGYTDYLILEELLQGEGWDDATISAAMPILLQQLEKEHEAFFDPTGLKVLPGVLEILDELLQRDVVLGLVTGNMKTIAERKLAAVGLWSYFTLGGFGNDPHKVRADLVRTAIRRGNFGEDIDSVYLVGDTVRDIQAAHDGGVIHSVGVANGFRPTSELIEAGAAFVFEDLTDTSDVIKKLLG